MKELYEINFGFLAGIDLVESTFKRQLVTADRLKIEELPDVVDLAGYPDNIKRRPTDIEFQDEKEYLKIAAAEYTIISLVSIIERTFFDLATWVKESWGLDLIVSDLSGPSTFDKTLKYMNKVARIPILDREQRRQASGLVALRNCIVHSLSQIQLVRENRREELLTYLKPYFTKGSIENRNGFIVIGEGYVAMIIDTVRLIVSTSMEITFKCLQDFKANEMLQEQNLKRMRAKRR